MKKMLLLAMAAGVSMAAFANAQEMHQVKLDAVPSQSQTVQLRVADQKVVSNTKIVSQKAIGNGYSLNVVSDANGNLRKVLTKNNAPKFATNDFNSVVPMAKGKGTMAAGNGVALSEGFEGYDGTSDNWIPEGWTLEASEALANTNYTWHGTEGDGMFAFPYEGDCMMGINAIMMEDQLQEVGGNIDEQNEWLITPSITISEYQKLYFYAYYAPLFLFDISKIDYVSMEFTEKSQVYTVRVLASVDNGEWVELYDLGSDWTDPNLGFMELLNIDATWFSYTIDLDEYVGKNVRFAFQYQGLWGDNFYIDAVSVATPQPQACYQRPGGAYFLGMDEEFMSINSDYMLAAPYADLTWYNSSNSDSESFVWSYTDPETGEEAISTDIDLTVNYPYTNGSISVPVITAYAEGADENSYGWGGDGILIGGSCMFSFTDGSIGRYGVSTADVATNLFTSVMVSEENMAFGFYPNSKELWSPMFGLAGDENNYVEVTEIGNLFPAPEVPYSLERVYLLGEGTVDAGTTINMTIYAVDENGYLGDAIAVGHISGSDVAYPMVGQGADYEKYLSMGFDILQKDEFGFEMPGIISVDSAIYVAITVENIGNSNFGFFQTAYPAANNETNGYFRIVGKQNGEDVNSLQPLSNMTISTGPCYSSFLFYLLASYDVMHCDESTTFNADNAGETKTYNVVSNYATAGWTVTKSDESADWFSYSVADGDGINSTITFDVDAMPSNITGRSCDVTITVSPSASLTFTVSQGDGSVESAVVASAAKVDVVDGDFVITAPASINAVSVYNIAGQLINTAAVDGTTTVDGASLAQGVYILKFNDGSSVKVVK